MVIDPISKTDLNGLNRQVKSFADEGVPDVEAKRAIGVEAGGGQIRPDTLVGYYGPELLDKTLLNYVRHYAYRHPSEPEPVTA